MKPTTAILASVCVLLIVLCAGCISFSQPDPNGTVWKLDSFGQNNDAANGILTLSFNNGVASGSSGVNTYAGSYTVSTGDGKLTFSGIASTKMTGPAALMTQETKYLNALSQTALYTLSGETLTLKDANGNTLLTFKEPLTGTSPTPRQAKPHSLTPQDLSPSCSNQTATSPETPESTTTKQPGP